MQENIQENNKKKRVLIQLRTTQEDKDKLIDFAKHAGMNITDFVKSRTIQKPPRLRVATPEREALLLMLSALNKIGVNINQIAHAMNKRQDSFYTVAVKEDLIKITLESLRETSAKIVSALDQTPKDDSEG